MRFPSLMPSVLPLAARASTGITTSVRLAGNLVSRLLRYFENFDISVISKISVFWCFDIFRFRYFLEIHKFLKLQKSGKCSGAANIKCCKPCNNSCQNTEAGYNDRKCKNAGGECKHSSNKCDLGYSGSMCDGPSERQCCGAR